MLGLAEQDAERTDSGGVEEELVQDDDDELDENNEGNVSEETEPGGVPSPTQQSPEDTENAGMELSEKAPPSDEAHDNASSTSSLVDRVSELGLGSDSPSRPSGDKQKIREVVAAQVSKSRARDQSKYHSRKNIARAGRAKGSKAKQDIRYKIDAGGIWG
jgi:RIO kinase 2